MAKVNFTTSDKASLFTLIAAFTVAGETIVTNLGQRYNPWQLMNELSIGSLKKIFEGLKKKYQDAQDGDPWSQSDEEKERTDRIERQKDLVYYIYGYRKWKEEDDKNALEIAAIDEEIRSIEEATLTPQQRIEALKAKRAELSATPEESATEPTPTTTETPATDK